MFRFKLLVSPLTKLLIFGLIGFSCSKDEDPQVEKKDRIFINEVYASSGDDWIELFNNNADIKDISGYRIYDDATKKYQLPSGTSIPAMGFLVLICDDTGTGLHTNFKVSSLGEKIFLENSSGDIIDLVESPIMEAGQSYGRYPDGSDKLGISGLSSQGVSNGDNQAAVIKNVSHAPLVPGLNDPVNVSAEVISNSGISTVTLFYNSGSGSFIPLSMMATGSIYQATIPALNGTGKVSYYIAVKNSFGMTTLNPFDAPTDTYGYVLNTDPLPQLRINEFMALNTSCCPDTDSGVEEFDDWIEIYNAGAIAVNLAGMYLSDDRNDPFKSRIPVSNAALTTIQPGGYLVFWADGMKIQGDLHTNFRLSSEGEDVGIFYIDGRTIDAKSFGVQQGNKSYGLTADGGTVWQVFSIPTQGLSNQ